ncbi:MAG: sulfotransferase [Planctomycetes bacterium]|nr:sulfotransferase [Planctomycetota bacterium]
MNDWPGFFLVGTGRCGSSLLRRLVGRHPEVHVPQETHWIPILHDFFGTREITLDEFIGAVRGVYLAKGKTTYNRILKQNGHTHGTYWPEFAARAQGLPRKSVVTLTTAFLEDIAAKNGRSLWGDKTPDYGQCMGLLERLWPGARFAHILRDGRDVALSMSGVRSFRFLAAWGACYWPAIAWRMAYAAKEREAQGEIPLDEFFDLWRRRLLRIRDEAARLAPGKYLEISYEDLLADPRAVLARVHEHLRLPGGRDWIEAAAADVRSGDAGKNRQRPEYLELTRRHAATLEALGFRP